MRPTTSSARRYAVVLCLLLAALAACRRTRPTPPVPEPTPTQLPTPISTLPSAAPDTAGAGRAAADRARAERERLEREALEGAHRTLAEPIHFEFDRDDLVEEARTILDAKLDVMRAHPGIRIRIDGHTDERGSDEYNIALGMRRAAAARRYLVQRNVDENRIEIASVGEERPHCQGDDESCWGQNRRDEFVIIGQ
jgi:peptidoglycan-associated lipoprotein